MRRWATVSIPPEHIGDRVPTNVVLECLHISLGHRVCQPLYLLRCADVAKPLLDTVDYHFPDLLAGNRGCGGYLADHLAVMAVQGAGEPHDLVISASELQRT